MLEGERVLEGGPVPEEGGVLGGVLGEGRGGYCVRRYSCSRLNTASEGQRSE